MLEIINTAPSAQVEIYMNGAPITIELNIGGYSVPGANGRSPEFRTSGGYLQYRLVGDSSWVNVYNLATIGSGTETTDVYTANRVVDADDVTRIILLSGATQAVTASIDPALFANQEIIVRCVDATNVVKVAVTGGVIETAEGDVTEVEFGYRTTYVFHSNGTNLSILR